MQTFQGFLQDNPSNATRDKVGMAVYYLQNIGGENYVTSSDIAALFNVNHIKIGESAIAAHLYNLQENGFLYKSDREPGTGYYLSPDGMERFERLSNDEVGSPSPEEISEDDLPKHYKQLYERTGSILTELRQQKNDTDKWRQRTKWWRILSGLFGFVGFIIGLVPTIIL